MTEATMTTSLKHLMIANHASSLEQHQHRLNIESDEDAKPHELAVAMATSLPGEYAT